MKVYIANFGRLSSFFPKSRSYEYLDDAKLDVDNLLVSSRWYGNRNAVIVIMEAEGYTTRILSIKQDGVWHDLT